MVMENLHLDVEGNAVPWDLIREVIDKLEYGTNNSIMFKTLLYTGCRISELENMKPTDLIQGFLIWKTGKNQTGYRKERMPASWIAELQEYRKTAKCSSTKLFNKRGQAFVDFFNKKMRPQLSERWRWKRLTPRKAKFYQEYVYQVKGLRKNFQTIKFHEGFRKYNDANIALEFISKKMRHSSKSMTFTHYIENCDLLEIEKYKDLEIESIINKNQEQHNLTEYFKRDSHLIA